MDSPAAHEGWPRSRKPNASAGDSRLISNLAAPGAVSDRRTTAEVLHVKTVLH